MSLARVFGGAPGNYGARAGDLALDGTWQTREELGEAYLAAVTHAYGGAETSGQAGSDFRGLVSTADVLVHPQDDRERDLLDGDGVADFAGGFAAAAALLGNEPELYHLDTSQVTAPKARRLAEEIARVVRGRLTNPRWLAGMLAHGHRGVAEIAQGVDALFAFAATARAVPDHLFDATHDALIADESVLSAMRAHNPAAAAAIIARLDEARARGLWMTRRNSVGAADMSLAATFDVKGWCPGALRPMQSGDGLIARVRPWCGAFSLAQASGLAEIAERLGNGHIDLTRRANLQIRGLREEGLPGLHDALDRLGLLDPDPATEAARNIMVGPLAGARGARPGGVAQSRPGGGSSRRCFAGEVRLAGRWRRAAVHHRRACRHRVVRDGRRCGAARRRPMAGRRFDRNSAGSGVRWKAGPAEDRHRSRCLADGDWAISPA